jgi:hypothetical protein
VFTPKKNEDKIRGSIKANASSSVKIPYVYHCDPMIEKVERSLYVWLEYETQKGLSVHGTVVRERAGLQ